MIRQRKQQGMGKTTISLDEEVADRLYARKSRGESYNDVIRELLDSVENGSGMPDDASSSNVSNDPLNLNNIKTLNEAIDAVADNVLPGTGEKHHERKEALHAVVRYLREHDEATPSEFKTEVYPEHTAQFSTSQSWWKNAMYKALAELAYQTHFIKSADNSGTWSFNHERSPEDQRNQS
jgi:hypothetical protein